VTSRPLALAGVAVGAVGTAGAIAALYQGMRDVMVDNGGFCASGGPYAVAAGHQCSSNDTTIMTIAPLAGLALAGLLVMATGAWSDGRAGGLGPLLWFGLFGALGWNFLDLGINPVGTGSAAGVWIGCGVMFELMALGGLVVAVIGLREYLFPGSQETQAATARPMIPIVRAAVNLGTTKVARATTQVAAAATRPGNAWAWLAVLVIGSGAGAWAGATIAA
jgi:hypothetical protein